MAHSALSDWLESLNLAGELLAVAAEVDPELELAAIVDRITRQSSSAGVGNDAPALAFEQVRIGGQTVVANLFGSSTRVCSALGIASPEEFLGRWREICSAPEKPGWLGKITGGNTTSPLAKFTPKIVKSGACQQVVKLGRDVDLTLLPALRGWPGEEVRSITAGMVLSIDPESAEATFSHSPLLVIDRCRLGIPWHPFLPLWQQALLARARGEKLPVAMILGGSPALQILSRLPLQQSNLLAFTGAWETKPASVVRCRTQPLDVPAEAELIIEGYLDPQTTPIDLPTFVGPNGQYLQSFPGQLVQVTALTQRTKALWPAVVYGTKVSELSALGQIASRLLLAELQSQAAEIVDLALPNYGAGGQFVVASVRQSYPGAVRRAANVIWGHAALMLAKTVILVDEAIPVTDSDAVWEQVSAHASPERDFFVQPGPIDPFDLSQRNDSAWNFSEGGRWGVDATCKRHRQGASSTNPLPGQPRASSETLAQLARRWAEYGLAKPSQKASKAAKA